MATLTDVLTNVFTLTSSVNSLKSDVARMNAMLLEMNERIIRLETGGELAAEKAKNAALMAFQGTNQELMKQMHAFSGRLDAIEAAKPAAVPEFRLGRGEGAPAGDAS